MKLTFILKDNYISIDGIEIFKVQQDFSWVPSNVNALQWYDTWGEIEYNDGRPNEKIEELGIFNQLIINFNDEKNKRDDENKQFEESRNYWEELRFLRNYRLSECDWTQVADVLLSENQKISWQSYRQALRDLPENITDPKPLVLDPNHPDWTIKPS
jgi:hypothetical protein